MLKGTIDFVTKFVPVALPLLLPWLLHFSIVQHLPAGWLAALSEPNQSAGKVAGPGGGAPPTGGSPGALSAAAEPTARALLSCLGFFVAYVSDVTERLFSYRQAKAFGRRYVTDIVFKGFRNEAESTGLQIGQDVRVNVMLTRGVPWLLFIGRRFTWFVHDGFQPSHEHHHDLGVRILTWQGLCGRAYRDEKSKWIDLRNVDVLSGTLLETWFMRNEFRMTHRQLKKTREVKAIISVPIFKQISQMPNEKYKLKGVINVDAVSDAGANWLLTNRQTLTDFFKQHGTVLAELA